MPTIKILVEYLPPVDVPPPKKQVQKKYLKKWESVFNLKVGFLNLKVG